jgi:hypothetical protein
MGLHILLWSIGITSCVKDSDLEAMAKVTAAKDIIP